MKKAGNYYLLCNRINHRLHIASSTWELFVFQLDLDRVELLKFFNKYNKQTFCQLDSLTKYYIFMKRITFWIHANIKAPSKTTISATIPLI